MSKIIKIPNIKPITCDCCGCVYEFETGDNIDVYFSDYMTMDGKMIVLERKLMCPCCHFNNVIDFENNKKKEVE